MSWGAFFNFDIIDSEINTPYLKKAPPLFMRRKNLCLRTGAPISDVEFIQMSTYNGGSLDFILQSEDASRHTFNKENADRLCMHHSIDVEIEEL